MKAVMFHGPGEPLTIETVDDPTPGPDDLILKVKDCGICGSDLHMTKPGSMAYPPKTVMGHEFAGEVYEVGKNVRDRWKVGMKACALPILACGVCPACRGGASLQCEDGAYIGLGQNSGAYAEFVRVRASQSAELAGAVSYRQGALVEPLAVGLHALRSAKLEPGAAILIVGAGPIGLSLALWARFLGVRHIVVSERAPERIDMAARFGATDMVNPSSDVGQQFRKVTGKPPDAVFDCVGAPGMLAHCISLAPPQGTIVAVGVCDQPDTFVPATALFKELTLRFVLGYRRPDFDFIIDMFRSERLDAEAMITDIVTFDAFPKAFEALRTPGHQCKVMLEPA